MKCRGLLCQPAGSLQHSLHCPGSQACRLRQTRQRSSVCHAGRTQQGHLRSWALEAPRLRGCTLGARARAQRQRSHAQAQSKGEESLPAEPPSIIIEIGVTEGETLESMAAKLGMPYERLLAANHGRKQVEPGEKLRFKMALPADQEGLAALLTPNKEAVKQVLAERRARQQAGQQQAQVVVVDAASAGERSVMLETAKYLGTSGAKVFLVCSAVWGLWRLARAATGSRAEPSRAAGGPPWPQEEGTPPPHGPAPAAEQRSADGAPVGDADGGRPARRAGWHVRNGNGRAPTNGEPGVTASSSLVQTEGGQAPPVGAYSGEDPPWLALPVVYYAQLPGGQQPSFRMAAGRPDARTWLVWEDPEDLRRLVRCMAGGGLMPMDDAGVAMVPVAPYEFLQTAEYNARAVAFLPAGTLVQEDWEEDALMEALQAAAQVVPREPDQAPGSAPAILARWRARAGVALSDEQAPAADGAEGSHGAWEVRSSMDEEDAPSAAQSMQTDPTTRAEAHHQQAPASSHRQPAAPTYGSPQPEGRPSTSSADAASRQGEEAHRRTMWQRLKGLVAGGRSGEPGLDAASGADPAQEVTTGQGRAEPDQAADDRLSAGRILERSASGTHDARGSAGATELTEQLFGPGPGAALAQSRAAAAAGEGSSGRQPNSGAAGAGGAAGSAQGALTSVDREARYAAALRGRGADADARSRLEQVRQEDDPFEAVHSREEEEDVADQHYDPSNSSSQNGAAPSGRAAGDLASDSGGSGATGQPHDSSQQGNAPLGWWRRLPVLHAPVRQFRAGGVGFLTADLSQEEEGGPGEEEEGGAPDQAPPRALVAFADRGDAQRVQWLWDAWGEDEPGQNSVMALPPAKLGDVARDQGVEVLVFDKGRLPLRPGISEAELGAMFAAYSDS